MSKYGQSAYAEVIHETPRAVVALAADYPADHRIAPHSHPRTQLVHAASGIMTVTAQGGAWVIPRGRAVWVPAGVSHEIRTHGPVAMRTLYIAPEAATGLPDACGVIAVSPLLRELILAAMTMPRLYGEDGAEGRLMAVMLDEMRNAETAPLSLPLPSESRLRRVTEGLLARPGDRRALQAWARTAGASPRTLARLFVRETGMTFHVWRQQARLLDALRRLASGQPVTTIAYDLGYRNPSAFITMFRRALGTTPGRFI